MPPNLDEIEYAPPFQDGLPASRPSLVMDYDSPSPDPVPGATPDPKPAIKLPEPKKIGPPPPDPLQKLLDLPILRPIPWKEGQDLPPSKSSEHERVQVRSAVLLSTRGDVAENPCNRCARGTGRFAKCVYKEGWFMGACATCQMSSKGNHCSFRLEKEAAAKAKTALTNSTNMSAQELVQGSPPGDTIHVNGPSMKRKRVSTEKAAAHTYEKTFDDDPNALLQYVFSQQQAANGSNKRHHQQYLAKREEDARVGKLNGYDVGRESYREEDPYSPAATYGGHERSSFTARATLPPDDEPLPLIDTFPRKKQKQLFAIIGSLQSGIRTSRQQTENLQKQLDSLQMILGIEPEEVEL
ncbi:hypothetical protein ONS95_009006 [Cadophora gregata]|uniref:uncharacterized protein n=1 Tax=Cadophora gregata TaxID=51156 RepID=UPI0026DD9262|nr:uncharacterized protein ONS95_009006 [Cadophora gregata]KAK0124020.1 hypothetical protein ONS95_009006 [Cadophora gregata]KAK0130355.1 hypothetical protein ONS96_000877 [Cadophora gregata f. sp. sojae]